MLDLDTALFLAVNATAATPRGVLAAARFASEVLPALLLGGTLIALVRAPGAQRRQVLSVVLALALAWGAARLLQALFPLPRPFMLHLGTQWLPHGARAGFPSTHASVAFAFGTAVALASRHPLLRLGAPLLAAWIAWSRVCLGLHFPSDVLAAALCGALCAIAAHRWLRAAPRGAGAPPQPALEPRSATRPAGS